MDGGEDQPPRAPGRRPFLGLGRVESGIVQKGLQLVVAGHDELELLKIPAPSRIVVVVEPLEDGLVIVHDPVEHGVHGKPGPPQLGEQVEQLG